MMTELEHLRQTERWIANVRAGGVVFAVLQVVLSTGYPPGYRRDAWFVTLAFALGATTLFVLSRLDLPRPRQLTLALGALAFDTGSPIRQVLYLAVTEAAVRFGIVAPLLLTVATVPVLIEFERLRSMRGDHAFRTDFVTFQAGSQVIVGLIVGWLVIRLGRETELSRARAGEAEELRDALGRRVTSSRPPTAAPAPSAPRWSSRRRSARSSARCAGSFRSSGLPSCWSKGR